MSSVDQPEIIGSSQVAPASSVYARPFGDELVLLEFGRGEYFALDEIGAVAWRGLEARRGLPEIADEIAMRYDVTSETALEDLVALVRKLHDHALVVLHTHPDVAGQSGMERSLEKR